MFDNLLAPSCCTFHRCRVPDQRRRRAQCRRRAEDRRLPKARRRAATSAVPHRDRGRPLHCRREQDRFPRHQGLAACAARELAIWTTRLQRAVQSAGKGGGKAKATAVDASQKSLADLLAKLCPLFDKVDPDMALGGADLLPPASDRDPRASRSNGWPTPSIRTERMAPRARKHQRRISWLKRRGRSSSSCTAPGTAAGAGGASPTGSIATATRCSRRRCPGLASDRIS